VITEVLNKIWDTKYQFIPNKHSSRRIINIIIVTSVADRTEEKCYATLGYEYLIMTGGLKDCNN